MTPEIPENVRAVFEAVPEPARARLLELRALILECAKGAKDVGAVAEVLRWGQPSYIADTGSMLRLGVSKSGAVAIYAHCQTDIVSTFAARFPGAFDIEGNRAVYVKDFGQADQEKLRFLILHGLRYKIC